MAAKNISILAALLLSSCSALNISSDIADTEQQEPTISEINEDNSTLTSSIIFQKQFNVQRTPINNNVINANSTAKTQNINDYVKALMQDLIGNLHHFNSSTPVAVVSFVMLDSDYNSSNIVGIQLAESLIHEVHNFGIPVIDFKTTGFVRVTPEGDFAFSKNNEDLITELAAQYIIGGTMLKHKDGYLINARIIALESKTVVASAQSLIPNRVITALVPGRNLNTEFKTVRLLEDKL